MSAESIKNEICSLWGNTNEVREKLNTGLSTLKAFTGSTDEIALLLLLQQNDLDVQRSVEQFFDNATPGGGPSAPAPAPPVPSPFNPPPQSSARPLFGAPPRKRKQPSPPPSRPSSAPKKRRMSNDWLFEDSGDEESDPWRRNPPKKKKKVENKPPIPKPSIFDPPKPQNVWSPSKRNLGSLKDVGLVSSGMSRQCIGRIRISLQGEGRGTMRIRHVRNFVNQSIFSVKSAIHIFKCNTTILEKEMINELAQAEERNVIDVTVRVLPEGDPYSRSLETSVPLECSIWLRNDAVGQPMKMPNTLNALLPNIDSHFPAIENYRLGDLNLENLLNFCCRYHSDHSEKLTVREYSGPSDFGLEVQLWPYQKQAVNWMVRRETSESGLFEELFTTIATRHQFTSTKWFYSKAFDTFLFKELPTIRGGILCEEMGLGKTIEFLALCNANPAEEPLKAPYYETRGIKKEKHLMYPSRATLVIAPPSLIGQWEIEIQERCKVPANIVKYYGKRSHDPGEYVDVDFVLTTYRILTNEHGDPDYKPKPPKPKRDTNGNIIPAKPRKPKKKKMHTLHHIFWHRVVLDESHYVKSMQAVQGKACCRLKAKHRWCLTGTPFNTSLKDLQGQLLFLGCGEPLSNKKWWEEQEKAFQNGHRLEIQPLLHVLKASIMRHRKGQKFNGEPMIRLPEKQEEVIRLSFTAEEKAIYDRCWKCAKTEFDLCGRDLNRHYFKLKSALIYPRQVCSGIPVDLADLEQRENKAEAKKAASSYSIPSSSGSGMMGNIAVASQQPFAEEDDECPICLDVPDDPLQTPCRHVFCQECIRDALVRNQSCPTCRADCKPAQLRKPPPKPKDDDEFDLPLSQVEGTFKFRTKLNYLLLELEELKRSHPEDKVLVFTSFNDQIEALQKEFKKKNLKFRCLTGSMQMEKRSKQLQHFKNDPNCRIFLMSIKSGAVGITLTSANHIFLMEPLQNPALYAQALNRVHRIGQKKKVFIKTLVMENSVETRIWDMAQSLMKQAQKEERNGSKKKNTKMSIENLRKLYQT